ncbi:MAG: sigma-70 family polymerase sigma factor [Conexibacter sp.]|nr:sigma-70 family polymerase sigma factor [Conexibacter sp.]
METRTQDASSGVRTGGAPIEAALEPYRRELTGYCYRMLGSGFEAEDAVQETMVRAWKNADRLTVPAALRSWLYRIATNVCLDMLDGAQRRARPMDLGPSSTADSVLAPGLPETAWVQPIADAQVLPEGGDPAEVAAARETVRLAFVAALQHLPPRQRAVLILREVLRWQASEVAELLDTSVASVNSALQRARATIDGMDLDAETTTAVGPDQQELLSRYVDAFERYDVTALVALLHEDATFSMPPHPLWLVGPDQVAAWLLGQGIGCSGSKVLTTKANGGFAYGAYKPQGDGTYRPFALAVVEVRDDRISGIHNFLYPELFAAFGMPAQLED